MIIGIDGSRAVKNNRTGTENYSYSLLKEIAKLDHKNQYYVYFDKEVMEDFLNQNNFKKIIIKASRVWTQYRLARELFKNTPEILFIPAHTLPIIRPRGMKTVVTIHDLGAQYLKDYHIFPERLYLNRSTEYALKYADHIIAVSKSTKEEINKWFPRPSNSTTVIYEAYDNNIFDYEKLKKQKEKSQQILLKYNIKRPYIFFLGTIQPRKNLSNLIKAFSEIKNNEISLVLAGKKGWLYEDILEMPVKLGLKDRVKFIDYVSNEDLPFLYLNALIFTFPSLCEGFGIPLLEAMACGVPVLSSGISSMPEVVGEAGVLVDPYSVVEISKAMQKLIDDENYREDLIKKGLKRVKMFSWEKAARETIEVFERIYER